MYKKPLNAPLGGSRPWPIREIILCILIFAAGIAVGYGLRGSQEAASAGAFAGELDESAKDDPAKGSESALLTIVEFADYQCGYCRQWYQQVFGRLMANYGDRIRFIFRDYPFLANAQSAAEAANCAHEQGRYWEYQNQLWGTGQGLDSNSLRGYAQAIGLDISQFDQCVSSHRFADEIQKDIQDGLRLGVNGTPAFIVNGQLLPGMVSYEQLAAFIDQTLGQ